MCRTTKRQFAHSILAYLAENPRAEDTVEGIVEWWLLDQRIRYELEGAREALVGLVGKGLVLERAGRDGRSRYRINARRLRDIKRMLNPDRRRPSATQGNKRND